MAVSTDERGSPRPHVDSLVDHHYRHATHRSVLSSPRRRSTAVRSLQYTARSAVDLSIVVAISIAVDARAPLNCRLICSTCPVTSHHLFGASPSGFSNRLTNKIERLASNPEAIVGFVWAGCGLIHYLGIKQIHYDGVSPRHLSPP